MSKAKNRERKKVKRATCIMEEVMQEIALHGEARLSVHVDADSISVQPIPNYPDGRYRDATE